MDRKKAKTLKVSTSSNVTAKHINNANNDQIVLSTPISPFFTLNVDCCDEIFALLPLVDLHSLSETCRTMQEVTGEYFQSNYRASKIAIKHKSFRLGAINLIGFRRFIEKLWISGGIEDYQFAGAYCANDTVKEIYFDVFALNAKKINCIKGVLANVQSVLLTDCIIAGDFYETFLKLCPTLRRLSVLCYEGFQNKWLFKKYPALEYLKLSGEIPFQFDDIKQFFINNSTVQQFAIDGRYLFVNFRSIVDAEIKWFDLVVSLNSNNIENMRDYQTLLLQLHRAGAYQRLHLFLNGKQWDESFIHLLSRVPAIVNLCLDYFGIEFKMPTLKDLKKFEVFRPLNVPVDELQRFAMDHSNLERIIFRETSSMQILPFICNTKGLKEIHIRICYDNYLDLAKLNRAREKLSDARRIIIYVEERTFVTTKRIFGQIQFDLIEMRRISAYESKTFYASFFG